MKPLLLVILYFSFSIISYSQNVGIANPAPAEKLDVNGNINLTGTIKINGVDGTANQVLMKNGSGNFSWGLPYPVTASSKSSTIAPQTSRNTWIEDPGVSVTVPSTGMYLIFFYGTMINGNSSFSATTSFDSDGLVRVFNSSFNSEIINRTAVALFIDAYGNTAIDYVRRYTALRPSASTAAYLGAGDVLKLQYMQTTVGPSPPISSWLIGNGEINILKIGN